MLYFKNLKEFLKTHSLILQHLQHFQVLLHGLKLIMLEISSLNPSIIVFYPTAPTNYNSNITIGTNSPVMRTLSIGLYVHGNYLGDI